MTTEITLTENDVREILGILKQLRNFEDDLWNCCDTDKQRELINDLREWRSNLYEYLPFVPDETENDQSYTPAWYPGVNYVVPASKPSWYLGCVPFSLAGD